MSSGAKRFPTRVAGWNLTLAGDYAEPFPGRGYVEAHRDGTFEVAYEVDQSARDMGLPPFLLTRIPAEVVRVLLAAYDAKRASAPAAPLAAERRLEIVEQLTTMIEQLGSQIARTSPDDRAAFADLATALTEMAPLAALLATKEIAS